MCSGFCRRQEAHGLERLRQVIEQRLALGAARRAALVARRAAGRRTPRRPLRCALAVAGLRRRTAPRRRRPRSPARGSASRKRRRSGSAPGAGSARGRRSRARGPRARTPARPGRAPPRRRSRAPRRAARWRRGARNPAPRCRPRARNRRPRWRGRGRSCGRRARRPACTAMCAPTAPTRVRGATSTSSARPKFFITRAADPTLPPRRGRTRTTRTFSSTSLLSIAGAPRGSAGGGLRLPG